MFWGKRILAKKKEIKYNNNNNNNSNSNNNNYYYSFKIFSISDWVKSQA